MVVICILIGGSSQSFKWYISSREDILKIIEYFKTHPSRSAKNNRLHLIPKYSELKDLKAMKAPQDSLLFKSWLIFMEKWNKQIPSSQPYYYPSSGKSSGEDNRRRNLGFLFSNEVERRRPLSQTGS